MHTYTLPYIRTKKHKISHMHTHTHTHTINQTPEAG